MSFYWVRFRRHNRDDLGGDRAQEPACPPLILGMASWADIFRDLRRQVRELKQEEVVSCPRGAISGFVFCQQDVGRLREPCLLLPLWNSETGPQQLHLARAPECCAGGERQRKGLASGSPGSSRHIFSQLCPASAKFGGALSCLQSWHIVFFKNFRLQKHCEMVELFFLPFHRWEN